MKLLSNSYAPRMIQLVARAGSASLFRNTGVPYFALRNWASQGRKAVTVVELLECRKSDLIIKNLKLTAEKNATQALLTLVLSTMKVFGPFDQLEATAERDIKNKTLICHSQSQESHTSEGLPSLD